MQANFFIFLVSFPMPHRQKNGSVHSQHSWVAVTYHRGHAVRICPLIPNEGSGKAWQRHWLEKQTGLEKDHGFDHSLILLFLVF